MNHKFTENKAFQRKWDKWLIHGWYNFRTFGWVWFKFMRETHPEHYIDGRMDKNVITFDHLKELNLKRCFMIGKDGYRALPYPKSEIRAYIFERSRTLSGSLFSDRYNRVEIFIMIDSFKWRYSREMTKEAYDLRLERKRSYHKKGITVTIRARNLSKDHEWNLTK